jgi:phosphoribosylanthranilate isomerase
VKIKICGLFREADIAYVNEAGPDYIGFVFAESRRQVSPGEAARLREKLREGIVPVGVFVNAPAEEILSLYRDGVIAIAQLHGNEDAAYIAALKEQCDLPVIKAIKSTALNEYERAPCLADYILIDNGPGGTGQPFNWDILNTTHAPLPWFLAGGIDSHNIEKAISYNPYGIDVSSGAETGGVKDFDKITKLVQCVRNIQRGG